MESLCSASGSSARRLAISSSASARISGSDSSSAVRLANSSRIEETSRAARCHGLELGIVATGGDELGPFERTRGKARLELGESRGDLRESGVGNAHAAGALGRSVDTRLITLTGF
jgi:hypothetical protein